MDVNERIARALAAALAEYRKIRPVASLEARSGEKGQ